MAETYQTTAVTVQHRRRRRAFADWSFASRSPAAERRRLRRESDARRLHAERDERDREREQLELPLGGLA